MLVYDIGGEVRRLLAVASHSWARRDGVSSFMDDRPVATFAWRGMTT
jgi:hypothetical protein